MKQSCASGRTGLGPILKVQTSLRAVSPKTVYRSRSAAPEQRLQLQRSLLQLCVA